MDLNQSNAVRHWVLLLLAGVVGFLLGAWIF